MSSVKVAVRVRPLSKKEIERNAKFVVDVNGDCISVTNVKVDGQSEYGDSRERVKHFTFDYCYDSASHPQSPAYASQQLVFQDLGTEILQAAFEGYNACVLAYGQTSTGKTYTMMGNQDEVGLIPRICEGLFSHVDDFEEDSLSFRVKISYLEIYNERVRDLLRPTLLKKNEKYTLKVREHPKEGPYVQDLSTHYVNNNSQIQSILERGNEYRTTASTYMHDHSSRSHAIVTIEFTQARLEDDLPHEIVSKIHLVDLAGSERADPSYGSHYKGRLREGANINKSLVTLGNVIKSLAEKSILSWSTDTLGSSSSFHSSAGADIGTASPQSGSPKKQRLPYIPYRDSVLTWLLRDSLGGNSKTVMISTVSPASIYYNETISTLRYAQRAKSIINKPKINEDPNVTLIRELRREIERLREMLLSARVADSRTSLNEIVYLLPPFTQKLHENEAEIKQGDNSLCPQGSTDSLLEEKLQENETMADQLTQTWIDKWREAHELIRDSDLSIKGLKRKASSMGVLIESQQPHLVGMDDDILSTGVTIYYLKDGKTLLGREDASREQDIVLKGPGIQREHCFIKNYLGTVTLNPNRNAQCAINGIDCKGPTKLKQGDYILLGKTNMFRYNNPAEAAQLRIRRQSSVEESLCQQDVERTSPDLYKTDLLRPIHPIYAHQQLDKQFDNDPQRLEEAKRELHRLQEDHRREEEARQLKEEELLKTHEAKRTEIEDQRQVLAEIAEENDVQKQRAEEEIAYARECLEEEKLAFQKYLQEEFAKLKTSSTASSQKSTQSQLESLSKLSKEVREVILQKKVSLEGRIKDLAQGELLKRLSYLESEQKLFQEAEDIEDQFAVTQEQLQSDLDRLKEIEINYRHSNASKLKDINTREEAITELEKKEEQLQYYIQEKQGLLQLEHDSPHFLRKACSEEVLTYLPDTDVEFPLRSSSLLALQRGSEGDLPSLSKRLSMTSSLNVKSMDSIPSGGDVEDVDMETNSTASASLCGSTSSLNSEPAAKSRKKSSKLDQKQGKLSNTANSVTDRLYKTPPPKFKYEPKEKKTPGTVGARTNKDVDRSKRGGSLEKDKKMKEHTPIRKPEEKNVENRNVSHRKSPARLVSPLRTQKSVTPSPQKKVGTVSRTHRLRQSVSQPSLHTDQRQTNVKVSQQRLMLPNKIHKIASASSLACVPEAVGEEGDAVDQSKDLTQNVVRRRKRNQFDDDDTRRHSAPIGDTLSEAFDKYTQDMGLDIGKDIPTIKVVEDISPVSNNELLQQESDLDTSSDTRNTPTTLDPSNHSSQSQSMHDPTFQSKQHVGESVLKGKSLSVNSEKCVSDDTNNITQEMECDTGVMADHAIQVECSSGSLSSVSQSTLSTVSSLDENSVDKQQNKNEGHISEGIQFKGDDLNKCIEVTCKQGSVLPTDVVFKSDSDTSPQESVHRSIELDSDSGFYPESSDNFESSGTLSFASALASRLSVGSEQDLQSPVVVEHQPNFDDRYVQDDSDIVVCSSVKVAKEKSQSTINKSPVRPTSFREDGVVFSETDFDNSSIASPGDVNFFLPESSDSGPEIMKPGSKRDLDSESEDSISVPPAKCRKEGEEESNSTASSDRPVDSESCKHDKDLSDNVSVGTFNAMLDENMLTTVENNFAQSSDQQMEHFSDFTKPIVQSEKKEEEDDGKYSSDSLEEDTDSLDGSKPHPHSNDGYIDEENLNDSLENSDMEQDDKQLTSSSVEFRDNVNYSDKTSNDVLEPLQTYSTESTDLLNEKVSTEQLSMEDTTSSVSSCGKQDFGQFLCKVNTDKPHSELAEETGDTDIKISAENVLPEAEMCGSESASSNRADMNLKDTPQGNVSSDMEIVKGYVPLACSSILSINIVPESTSLLYVEPTTGQTSSAKTLPNSVEVNMSSSLSSTSPGVKTFAACNVQNSELSTFDIPSSAENSDKDMSSVKHMDHDVATEPCDLLPEAEKLTARAHKMSERDVEETTIFNPTGNSDSLGVSNQIEQEGEILTCDKYSSPVKNKESFMDQGAVSPIEYSVGVNTDRTPSTRTLGVSTSPNFLVVEHGETERQEEEDTNSQCSHDSIQELQEQLQELEEFPVTQKGAVPNNLNNNTQLSSARKAARQRAMIRQKCRGADVESDDINQCSDDSQGPGNQAKPSSRPTSASRRRRRTNVKSSKRLRGLSSEEYLTSESDGVYTEDSVTNKETGDSAEENTSANRQTVNHRTDREQVTSHSDKNDGCRKSEFLGPKIDESEQLLHERNLIPDEERYSDMDRPKVNGFVNPSNGNITESNNRKHKAHKIKPANNILSVEASDENNSNHKETSRSPSETRDIQQQTEVSLVEETIVFPVDLNTEDPALTMSPVSVWATGEKGLAVYGPHRPHSCQTPSADSGPVKRRKNEKPVKLEITPPEIWSAEIIGCSSTDNTTAELHSESDEDDCSYVMETEVYSPQTPSFSDKFFSDGTSAPKSIKYHVTVNEENTNITYNVDRTEYRTYGLRSQIHNPDTPRIPETISINLSESSTEITDSRLESIRNEHVNFQYGDHGSSVNHVIAGRRFHSVHDATRDRNDSMERHFEEEMNENYLENRQNTSTPHPINISVNSEDLAAKPECLLSPRESDTTSDYGTLIMDSRKGGMSFTLDSGDEVDSFAGKSLTEDDSSPIERVFPPTYSLNRFSQGVSNVPAWLQVGTECEPQTEENAIESLSREGQQLCSSRDSRTLYTIPSSTTISGDVEHVSNIVLNGNDTQNEASNRSLSSEEEEITVEETLIVVPVSSGQEIVLQGIFDTKLPQEDNRESSHSIVELNNNQDESSGSSIYQTPQPSPRNNDSTSKLESENTVMADLPTAHIEPLPNLNLELTVENTAPSAVKSLEVKSTSVNTDTQQTPRVRNWTVDDGSVREELKRELQQKLARLQRHVRSLSDSAISSDYTDGDSTSVSPRGSRLCESDKTLRAGVFLDHEEQFKPENVEVMTTQSEKLFSLPNGEPFLSSVAKLVDIDNKEPKKSPLKDSGNVFDDGENIEVEDNIEPVNVEINNCFPTVSDNLDAIMNAKQQEGNGQTFPGTFNSVNSLDSDLKKSDEHVSCRYGSKEYGSDLDYSDVLYTDETSDSRSASPGEVYLDGSTPEAMFRSIAMDAPSQESVCEDNESDQVNGSHVNSQKLTKDQRSRIQSLTKEKSPSLSDINTGVQKCDEIKRSYSENNVDEFEEDESNSGNSNDSIVFVFMGQSHSKDSIEKLKNEGYSLDNCENYSEQNQMMGNVVIGMSSSNSSEDNIFRPIQDTSSENNSGKDFGQSQSDKNINSLDEQELHHGVSCDSPLRHRFGIDENVLPIPERSISSDNLPKQNTNKQTVHRSRSASLLDVVLIENPDDPSNNEGIFPPYLEDYESSAGSRETHDSNGQVTIHDRKGTHQSESDPGNTKLENSESFEKDNKEMENGFGSQDLLYSSLPLENHFSTGESLDQVDYNGNLPCKEPLVIRQQYSNPLASEPTLRFVSTGVQASLLDSETQTDSTDISATRIDIGTDVQMEQHRILPALAAPYRAQSVGDLGQPDRLTAMNFSEDTNNWQHTSTVAIETNALLNKINEKHPGMTSNSSLTESLNSTETTQANSIENNMSTQTGTSLTNLQDLEVQTDFSYFERSLNLNTSSTQTDRNITNPRGTSETETNEYLPMSETVHYHESATQTDSEEDSQSIEIDTIDNANSKLSSALKNDSSLEQVPQIEEDIKPECYEKAKSPLKLRAGVKSVSRLLTKADGSSSDSEVFDSNSNLAVGGKIVKEERHEKQHESKFSNENTQTVVTERECVVENQVNVPNMDVTNAEMNALKSEHAKMMEALKKASEERQARKEALKLKLLKMSSPEKSSDVQTNDINYSYETTINKEITETSRKNHNRSLRSEVGVSKLTSTDIVNESTVKQREDENVDLDAIFQENQLYCSTHQVSDNLSDIVINSDEDFVDTKSNFAENYKPRQRKANNLNSNTNNKLDKKSKVPTSQSRNKDNKPYVTDVRSHIKVVEDEIIPVIKSQQELTFSSQLGMTRNSRMPETSASSISPSYVDGVSSTVPSRYRFIGQPVESLRRKDAQNNTNPSGNDVNETIEVLGSPTLTTPPNSPVLGVTEKEDQKVDKKTMETVIPVDISVESRFEKYLQPSLSSDVTQNAEKGGKISTGVEVQVDSSDDFTQTDLDSLKLDLASLDRNSDRILRNRDASVTDEKSVKQELGRLKKERIEIIELLSMNYLPASLTVELLEAKLNYCIGQTDMLLKTLEDHCDLDTLLETDFSHHSESTKEYLTSYRSDLYKSKQEIEICKKKIDRTLGSGRGRKITRNRDTFKWRRNAEIEAFRVERMIEQRNYDHTRSLSPHIKPANTSHNDSLDRVSRNVSPASTEGSPHHMTPMQHRNHLIGLRRKLIEETEHEEFVHRISRSCSPQSFYSDNEFSSPRCRSYSPTHLLQSPEHQLRSPYGSNTMLAPPPISSSSYIPTRSFSHSPVRSVRKDRSDTYYYDTTSPMSYSPRSTVSPPRNLATSVLSRRFYSSFDSHHVFESSNTNEQTRQFQEVQKSSRSSISPPRYPGSSVSPRRPYSSLDSHRSYENSSTCEQTSQLFQEMQEARLKNQQEISRAQSTLGSLKRYRDSPVRSRSNSVASSKKSYSSYKDYAKDVMDSSHRATHGVVTGSYELYTDDISHSVLSPTSSAILDLDSLSVPESSHNYTSPSRDKYSRTRPVQSSDIKTKLFQKQKKLPFSS